MKRGSSTLSPCWTPVPCLIFFRADESRALVAMIDTHAAAIANSTFSPTFVALHSYAVEQFVLAITRFFDRPKKNYPLRSLPAIVEHVFANAESLPVREPNLLAEALKHLGAPIAGLGANCATTQLAVGALRALMPSPETHSALDALKALRDKRLAHPEHVAVESIPKTAWVPADELLRTAQLMIAALGDLTSTAHIDSAGRYFLKSDAECASVATHRLLRKLQIAPLLPYQIELGMKL
jgi:hypothetical protein